MRTGTRRRLIARRAERGDLRSVNILFMALPASGPHPPCEPWNLAHRLEQALFFDGRTIMAIVVAGGAYPLDFRLLDLPGMLTGTATVHTATSLVIEYGGGDRDEFTGVGFTYSATGEPTGGTITGFRQFVASNLVGEVTGASASVAQFMTFVKAGDTIGGVLFILSGDDQITGGAFADYLAGGAGNDTINGLAGDDTLIGNAGNDTLNGGAGTDTAVYGAASANFTIARTSAGWSVTDKAGTFGVDSLIDVERVTFSDRTINLTLTDPTVATYAANIVRGGADPALSMSVANGLTTTTAALGEIMKAAGATTSVATLSYQFFTGKIPSLAGVDYLVASTGQNPNNLNSAYYQSFNLENRYINFAVNLGKIGEGNAKFTAEYGALSLFDATKKAYGAIFGVAASDDKAHALLDPSFVLNGKALTRAEYFASYGGDGASGIGTKAAMVGWLLAEAVKADVGMYAKANDAFLADLSDGANFAVDMVGVYGRPEYAQF
jgi:Ca2+-binding RTX toxin-like protein